MLQEQRWRQWKDQPPFLTLFLSYSELMKNSSNANMLSWVYGNRSPAEREGHFCYRGFINCWKIDCSYILPKRQRRRVVLTLYNICGATEVKDAIPTFISINLNKTEVSNWSYLVGSTGRPANETQEFLKAFSLMTIPLRTVLKLYHSSCYVMYAKKLNRNQRKI